MLTRTITFIISWVIFLLMMLYGTPTFGQNGFLSSFSQDLDILPVEIKSKIDFRFSDSLFTNKRAVILNDFHLSVVSGFLNISIPDVNCSNASYQTRFIDYRGANDYFWYGEIRVDATVSNVSTDTCACQEGMALLYRKDSILLGQFNLDGQSFNLYSIDSIGVIAKSKLDNYPISCEQDFDSIGVVISQNRNTGDNCAVNVLFLLTENAVNNNNITNLDIYALFRRWEVALKQSQITEQLLKPRLVGIEIVPSAIWEESSSTVIQDFRRDIELQLFPFTTGGYFNDIRSQYKADVIVGVADQNTLLLNGVAGNTGNSVCAIQAFTVRESELYVFEHEMGHVFGADHQRCEDFSSLQCRSDGFSQNPLPARAWVKCKRGRRCDDPCRVKGTILSPGTVPGKKLHYYSNPFVIHPSYGSLGKVNFVDNAHVISDNACKVASFNTEDNSNDFYAYITSISEICAGESTVVSATIVGANGPYSYAWEVSYDGGITFDPLSSNWQATVTIPSNYSLPSFVFRVRVLHQPSNTEEITLGQIFILHSDDPSCPEHKQTKVSNFPVLKDTIYATPNILLEDKVYVSSSSLKIDQFRMVIQSVDGKIIFQSDYNLDTYNRVEVLLPNLHRGVHFVTFSTNGKIINTQKIVKL